MTNVTVVIPAYNPAGLLARALDSVIAQTYTEWDCLVIDDGGSEDLSWVDRYHPQVRRHRQSNAGVSAARNAALSLTDAPLLAYLDQDDEWLPDKLAAQVPLSADVSYTAFEWIHPTGEAQPNPAHRFDYHSFLAAGHICLSSLVANRSLVSLVGGFNPLQRVQQDYDLVLRLLRAGAAAVPVEKVLVRYYLHGENVSGDYVSAYRERVNLLDLHRIDAERRGDSETVRAARRGLRRTRELYGGQAFDAFRESRRPAHLLRSARWNPRFASVGIARAMSSRVRG